MRQPHPMQPVERDKDGVLRFKENAIVRYLLDWCTGENGHVGYPRIGGRAPDLNQMAIMPFSKEDRQQFAQLIGYSVSGYGELSYVDDAAYSRAEQLAKKAAMKKKANRRSK